MEERFELFGKHCIKDNSPNARPQLFDAYVACIILNEQYQKIKDLEAKLVENKEQLIDMNEKSNKIKKESYYLKQQLKSQPADIIKKIKKEFQKHLIDWYEDEENTNSELYLDADWVWEILDTILKEYQK